MSEETKPDRVDQSTLADDSAPVNEALDDASAAPIDDDRVPSWSTPANRRVPSANRAASTKEEK